MLVNVVIFRFLLAFFLLNYGVGYEDAQMSLKREFGRVIIYHSSRQGEGLAWLGGVTFVVCQQSPFPCPFFCESSQF